MRFRDLSQSAVQCLWDRWNPTIRELVEEFNEDVFDGRGKIRENGWRECLYLLLETKTGCLYIFPLPGNSIALRLLRHKPEKVDPALIAALRKEEHENYVGGFQVNVDMVNERHTLILKAFRTGMAIALQRLYRDAWLTLLY